MTSDHYIKHDVPFPLYDINLLEADEDDLVAIMKDTMAGHDLSEMKEVQKYFRSLGRNPTDVEFQALGQAWSEHSCYKTSKPILKKNIFNIDAPQNILVIKEDAGVLEFDEDHAYVVALESHNHPSAIEPYGGAATGIGGILRDVVCMGGQPVALTDPLFFGSLDFPKAEVPKGVKHPVYLLSGVVDGIRDYGNRVGIPTVAGQVTFHNGYLGNCLVNVGCVGMVEKKHIIRSRVSGEGDVFIYAGGRTGRDGIHGVTFASADLHEESESESRGAVQLGDPITKEPLIHACIEANENGLLAGMKDFGGGGLSSVVGEMALHGGCGCDIELDKVPTKEEGIAPWELWISESQERMLLAVRPENVEKVLQLMADWDVEAVVVGRSVSGEEKKVITITYEGAKVLELDLDYYTGGPEYNRPYEIAKPEIPEIIPEEPKGVEGYNEILLGLLNEENICSKDWVIRQYDHEVRGRTVIKPLQGKLGLDGHGDSAVIKPLENSFKGLAISCDVNPRYTSIDPYRGSLCAMDENCRNLVAVGGRPHSFADCLNFGNPETPTTLGTFVESTRALGEVARYIGVPFCSGNVSFYNETQNGPIPPTPTILGIGMVEDIRKCVTADLKLEGATVYVVGETKDEMGGSAYLELAGGSSGNVPDVEVDVLKRSIDGMLAVIENELVSAVHDISEGGIGVCLAEMALAGDVGVHADTSKVGSGLRSDVKLFSESQTRWIVEVRAGKEKEFEERMYEFGLSYLMVGGTGGDRLIISDGDTPRIDLSLDVIRKTWQNPLHEKMGN